ncbi:MAG: hypothetical protein RJQ10_13455 [Haliea sp.]|uniref:hypothetical protein n=1 Tax=Haliea sp. TaxID=1932666 RepID=UPI0032EF4988
MKTLTAMIMGMVLASTSLASLAARDDSRGLVLCKAGIEAALGDSARSKLIGIKRRKGPDEMRIMVVPAEGERLVVSCLVEGDAVRFQDRNGLALHLGGFEGIDTVMLNH